MISRIRYASGSASGEFGLHATHWFLYPRDLQDLIHFWARDPNSHPPSRIRVRVVFDALKTRITTTMQTEEDPTFFERERDRLTAQITAVCLPTFYRHSY